MFDFIALSCNINALVMPAINLARPARNRGLHLEGIFLLTRNLLLSFFKENPPFVDFN